MNLPRAIAPRAIARGGSTTLGTLFVLNLAEAMLTAIAVVGPDIAQALSMSDTALAAVLGFGGAAAALFAIPLALAADRIRRLTIVSAASLLWAATLVLWGLSANFLWFFLASSAAGLLQAFRMPVAGSLISDIFASEDRTRAFALESLGRPLGLIAGPLLVGLVAGVAGGGIDAWRWLLIAFAGLPLIAGLMALRIAEPSRGQAEPSRGQAESPRGHFESQSLGSKPPQSSPQQLGTQPPPKLRVTIATAIIRLRKARTLSFVAGNLIAVGFALIAVPGQLHLLLEDKYGLDSLERAIVASLIWIPSLLAIGAVAALARAGGPLEQQFRSHPERLARWAGFLTCAAGFVYLIALPARAIGLLLFLIGLAQALASVSLVGALVVISKVAPFRIRAQAFALLPVFFVLVGGILGGLAAGQVSDAFNNRTALIIMAPLIAAAGGLLLVSGARHLPKDIALVAEELQGEQATSHLIAAGDLPPTLSVRNLDFSYGAVQVLFGVDLEVARGQTVALLGANGAGKTTLLRVISGLGTCDRGSIRLNGKPITFTEAERRFRAGIVHVRGGQGIFANLSVEENLRASLLNSGFGYKASKVKIADALETFGALRGRLDERAGDLSGGQQQMLALAMGLVQAPELLCIDELSLGLAPVVVEELLEVVAGLKERGQSMLIVDQSLHVAQALADRLVILEKGEVRFEGSVGEFSELGHAAGAVFLGASS